MNKLIKYMRERDYREEFIEELVIISKDLVEELKGSVKQVNPILPIDNS